MCSTGYGTPEHEYWLIEMERTDAPFDERPDEPWTPCGCTARAYGGDCAHTVEPEDEPGPDPIAAAEVRYAAEPHVDDPYDLDDLPF